MTGLRIKASLLQLSNGSCDETGKSVFDCVLFISFSRVLYTRCVQELLLYILYAAVEIAGDCDTCV